MMKRMSFLLLGMLLNMLPVMASPSDSLTFSNVRTEGVLYPGMPIKVHVEVTNNGDKDYYSMWSVGDGDSDWSYWTSQFNNIVEIRAGSSGDITLDASILKAGDLELHIYEVTEKKILYSFQIHVEEGQPKISASIKMNFKEDASDGSHYIYSDFKNTSFSGEITITNEEEESIFRDNQLLAPIFSMFQATISPEIAGTGSVAPYGYVTEIPEVIKSGETVTGHVTFILNDCEPVNGMQYIAQVEYNHTIIASSEPFTFRYSTNTYWTFDGVRSPLTISNDTLKIPKDAAAVDLRGLYYINTVFKIDVTEANPNCLYYIGFLDYVPKGFTSDANIIRENEANMLSIDSNYDFYCPVDFTAKTAFFTYTPVSESRGPASPVMSQRMSGMITVPFDAQKAWLAGTNEYHEDSPFYNEDFKIANQWGLDEDGTIVFWPLTPDAIVSRHFCYLIYDMKPSPLVFYSEDAYIFSSDYGREIVVGHNRSLIRHASRKTRKAEKYTYSWNCDRNCFVLNKEGATIRPFNVTVGVWDQYKDTLVDTGQEILPYYIDSGEGGLVNIKSPRRTPEDKAIYSISGQRVGTAAYQDGRLCTDGLKPGLYIVGGKKVVVK
jgi:hypothetical protein